MNNATKRIASITIAATVIVGLAACAESSESSSYKQRLSTQKGVTLENSLEKVNLKARLELENDRTRIGYLYVMSFGTIVGYYTVKGKVSSSGSQLGPEVEIVQPWSGGERYVVDSAQDDGTYGTGDPGVFFFTTEGAFVSTNLDHLYSTQPIAIDTPRLG